MKFEMKMPDLATTASSMKILGWLKKPGESVRRGELALEIETDKAAVEVEATVNGILLETKVEAGSVVAAGDVVAIIEVEEQPTSAVSVVSGPATKTEDTASIQSTLAKQKASGMFARNRDAAGKSTEADRKQGTDRSPTALSPARRTAARRLQESKQTVPHFYLQTSARVDALVARRNATTRSKLLWDAFFVKAVSNALKRFEKMAFYFENDTLVPQGTGNIGVAADIDGELFVVSVDSPAEKEVEQVSENITSAVEALRSGDVNSRQIRPGVITISNLGGTGIESFSAIINPPEAAILAIGMARAVIVPNGNTFAMEHRINLTLSVDHRVVNGKYAAEFLAAIAKEIEAL
jgi:pyruvate dehydrogenase E2 component (dihydrolipoamide acetyltransferase)